MKQPRILNRRKADDDHEVVSVEARGSYCRTPCPQCPWRRDVPVGVFPAEAFRMSADTAYDMSNKKFGCHMTPIDKVATCAGFILSGSRHNMSMRMAWAMGSVGQDVVSDAPLYDSYRQMAEANGVHSEDPALQPCRD